MNLDDIAKLIGYVSSVVTIITGTISIIRTLQGKETPAFTTVIVNMVQRVFGRKPTEISVSQSPSASASATDAKRAVALKAPARPSSGWLYGIFLSIPTLLAILGLFIVVLITIFSSIADSIAHQPTDSTGASLLSVAALMALFIILILSGLLPARATGKLSAAFRSGVALAISLAVELGILNGISSIKDGSSNPITAGLVTFALTLLAVIPILVINIPAGLLGRRIYRRKAIAA